MLTCINSWNNKPRECLVTTDGTHISTNYIVYYNKELDRAVMKDGSWYPSAHVFELIHMDDCKTEDDFIDNYIANTWDKEVDKATIIKDTLKWSNKKFKKQLSEAEEKGEYWVKRELQLKLGNLINKYSYPTKFEIVQREAYNEFKEDLESLQKEFIV